MTNAYKIFGIVFLSLIISWYKVVLHCVAPSPTQIHIPRLVSLLSLLSYVWAFEVMSKKHEHLDKSIYAGSDSPARRDGTCAHNEWHFFFRWGRHSASVSHSCSLMLGCHASMSDNSCPPKIDHLLYTPSFHTVYWHSRLQYSSLCRQLLEGDVTWTLYPSTLAVSVWDI